MLLEFINVEGRRTTDNGRHTPTYTISSGELKRAFIEK